MLPPEKVDAFVEAGAAAAQAEIDKLAEFRHTPSWSDLQAAIKGTLRFIATYDPSAEEPAAEEPAAEGGTEGADNVVSITTSGAGVVPAPVDGGASGSPEAPPTEQPEPPQAA
jgi:hypothetical protein